MKKSKWKEKYRRLCHAISRNNSKVASNNCLICVNYNPPLKCQDCKFVFKDHIYDKKGFKR